MTKAELQAKLNEVETMLSLLDSGDTVTTIRMLRSQLYYLQEQINVWEEFDCEMEEQLISGIEGFSEKV